MIQFIGRLHVLFLHLPIGFIILLALLEPLARRPSFKHITPACRAILVFTVPITILSAICGWLLSWSGGYDASLLFWHKWLGTTVAVATIFLLLVHVRGWLDIYRPALYVTLVLLIVASHFGGSLTHGSNYFSFSSRKKSADAANDVLNGLAPGNRTNQWHGSSERSVYDTAIHPLLDTYCVPCHGPEKSKAKLRLDTIKEALKGGEAGPVIVAGNASESLLIQRLKLPLSDEDHMPPESKKQPTPEEIVLLEWWINAGAPADKPIGQLNPPDNILQTIQSKTAPAP